MDELAPDAEAVDWLVRLRSPDRFVRRKAAQTLGQRRGREAVPALIDLLDERDDVFGAGADAARALGEIGDHRAVEPLIAALPHPFLRGAAVEALVRLGDDRALGPLIRLFDETRDPSLATVLGRWGDRRAVGPLVAAMGDANPHVRYYAARALGMLGDGRGLPCLERAADDTCPITDAKSLRGKSVAYAAARAIRAIRARAGSGPDAEPGAAPDRGGSG